MIIKKKRALLIHGTSLKTNILCIINNDAYRIATSASITLPHLTGFSNVRKVPVLRTTPNLVWSKVPILMNILNQVSYLIQDFPTNDKI